ncbi:hypothetical protein RHGRI_036948 [Rhododendron griersonianum]|uniref:Aminotransferase-like plant mobile domain-containing protein n=1 Tax=Rhododendron griersonianum TaxID=479676 RepID=A0AAV6HU80_9ERIC|nr:hypothetical protein RHGRI_036948 [Rhododendron griersonianum]
MYKSEVVPLSELLQAATCPTNEMELGELAELKSKLKQTVDYESDTPKDAAAWIFFNEEANEIAHRASDYKVLSENEREFCQLTLRKSLPMLSNRLSDFEVIFDPYKNRRQNVSDIAFYTGPIRAMSYVEPYLPDRVLRQFGLLQRIPADPIAPQRASRGQHTYHVVYEWTEGFWSSPDYHLVLEDKRERTPPGIPWACTDDYIPWLSVFSH